MSSKVLVAMALNLLHVETNIHNIARCMALILSMYSLYAGLAVKDLLIHGLTLQPLGHES